MPQLGESVTEGTVTRWLKKEGEHVTVDEPLLEVSTDKVDTEIPSPASGVRRGIAGEEDETVEVGAQLAMIEDSESASAPEPAAAPAAPAAPEPPAAPAYAPPAPEPAPAASVNGGSSAPGSNWSWSAPPPVPSAPAYAPPPAPAPAAYAPPPAPPAPPAPAPAPAYAPPAQEEPEHESYPEPAPLPSGESPYVTPLVRKLAAEHSVPLEAIEGTGVGGRIRKQDVLEAA